MDAILNWLSAGDAFGPILLVTVVLGGGAAALTGRATALAWQPPSRAALAMLPLAAADRFIHFALFGGTLLSAQAYARDLALFVAVSLLAWRATRTAQMVRQYPWLYARSGPLSWRKIEQENAAGQC